MMVSDMPVGPDKKYGAPLGGYVHESEQVEYFGSRLFQQKGELELEGKYYLDLDGTQRRIIRAFQLRPVKGMIQEGLALLLDDEFWRFGCDASHVIELPD